MFQYIDYNYPIQEQFDKVLLWVDSSCELYFAFKDTSADDWTFYSGESDHSLAANSTLVNKGASESDAQTNYWAASPDSNGKLIAVLPSNVLAKYVRLYINDSTPTQIHEFRPSTNLIADEIISGQLHITDQFASPPIIRVTSAGIDRITIGNIAGSTYGIVGYNNAAATIFELSDNQNKIGGLTVTASSLSTGGIIIDGENNRIRSTNYVSGASGEGFTLEPNLLEVGNVSIRGELRGVVMAQDTLSGLSGDFVIANSDVLASGVTAGDSQNFITKGLTSFEYLDVLNIKNTTDEEWLVVTGSVSATEYTVQRDKAGSYPPDTNPTWTKGQAIINYRQVNEGVVRLTSADANGPFISVTDHSTAPWTDSSERVRIGNLNGFLDYTGDYYGLAIGESSDYLAYDSQSKLRMRGARMIQCSGMYQNVYFPDPEAGDQGAISATYTTVAGIKATVGGYKYATIVLQHSGAANNTNYNFSTTTSLTANFTTIAESGVVIKDTGNPTLTFGPFYGEMESCFDWDGSGDTIFQTSINGVSVGNSGEVLTSSGTSGAPTWSNSNSSGLNWYNVISYGAIADSGVTDNTTAFQAAIDAASAAGGGIVFVPANNDDTYFGFANPGYLTLPSYVHLLGQSTMGSYKGDQGGVDGEPRGSILGVTDTSNIFIRLAGCDITIRGLTFWYPNQTKTNPPITYPATIGMAGVIVTNLHVEDCVAMNPYIFIYMTGDGATYSNNDIFIKNIAMQALNAGFIIYSQWGWLFVDNIWDSGRVWTQDSNIIDYMHANSYTALLGANAVSWSTSFSDSKKAIIKLVTDPIIGDSTHGSFTHVNSDDVVNGFIIEATQQVGITIDDCLIVCSPGNEAIGYFIVQSGSSRIMVTDSRFWGLVNWGIINTIGGEINLDNCYVSVFSGYGESGTLALNNCSAKVTNSRFFASGVAGSISIGSNMTNLTWINNKINGNTSGIPTTTSAGYIDTYIGEDGIVDVNNRVVVTSDKSTKTELTAHFVARSSTNPSQMLAMGYDSNAAEGWIKAVNYGVEVRRLYLQPGGGETRTGGNLVVNNSNLQVDGNAVVGGTITSSGAITSGGTLTSHSNLQIDGNAVISGTLTSGGADPPYELFWNETRESVVRRIKVGVPPMYLDGCVIFYNGELDQMELFIPLKGEFRNLQNKIIAKVPPVTETIPVKKVYYMDSKTGEVAYRETPIVGKYIVKDGYTLNETTGEFHRIDKNGKMKSKVDKEKAVKFEHGSEN